MCPPPALPMNLSINTSPARMAASAILSEPPARFFLLNHVRSQSLFNRRSSMEKTELSSKSSRKKYKKNHQNTFQEIGGKGIQWLSKMGFQQQNERRRGCVCQSRSGIKGIDMMSTLAGTFQVGYVAIVHPSETYKWYEERKSLGWFNLLHSKQEY